MIELHVFTNSTHTAPSTKLIEKTIQSFTNLFGPFNPTVWCDINPNIAASNEYIANLKKLFKSVNETSSLSDGYVQAVKKSNSKFLFMLEHDWVFNNNILHPLNTILEVMDKENLMHLRFNKRMTVAKKFDKGLIEINHPIMPYCKTAGISNNPHIINKELYVKLALPLINIREKSYGIEKELSSSNLFGAIYGPLNYANTITHLDGKTYKD